MKPLVQLPALNPVTTEHWRADFRGGLAAAAVALPLGLAFGVVSGTGPVAGIYCAICTGLLAALFGGTPTQIAGPTGPMAIVMASVVANFADQPGAAIAVVMLAGFIQIAFGALRLGPYIRLIPSPVLSGFASGVGCIIIVMQLNPLLGQPGATDTVSAALTFPESLARGNPWAVLVAAMTMGICHFTPKRVRKVVPAELIALIAGSSLVLLAGLDLPRLARPETLLPSIGWPAFGNLRWGDIWMAALVLALISSLESLLTSMAADSATQRFHDSDKELMGQGLGNLFAGMLGAIPGAGATARTMVNIRAGGISPLSGIIHSVLLLAALLIAGPLIRFIPSAVLAGILLYIGLRIVDWAYIQRFKWAPRSSVVIMLVVWFLAVFVSVIAAVAVGVMMASLLLVKRMTDLQLESVELSSDEEKPPGLDDTERAAFAPCASDALLIHLGGPMTFGAANGLTQRLATIADYKAVILDFSDVPHVDDSAAMALESIIERAANADQLVIVAGLRRAVVRSFIRYGMQSALRRCVRFRQRLDALRYACQELKRSEE
ncbi:MAG TPA: SulP family inorganic anion transporter [Gammaproteobacteria bacterium]|nr:SulP family inorganic anion transporter [Gammaproteobacteria bacterium]